MKKFFMVERNGELLFMILMISFLPKVYVNIPVGKLRTVLILFVILLFLVAAKRFAAWQYYRTHTDRAQRKEKVKCLCTLLVLAAVMAFVAVLLMQLNQQLLRIIQNSSRNWEILFSTIQNALLFPVYANLFLAIFYSKEDFVKGTFVTAGKMIKKSYLCVASAGILLGMIQFFLPISPESWLESLLYTITTFILWELIRFHVEKNMGIGEWIHEILETQR